jgi:glycine cleavage system H protein
MTETLDYKFDKFIFRVATDRFYSSEGLWVKLEGKRVRIGISDYLQQRSGDVAFTEVKPEGTLVAFGEEVAVIETIKVNISLTTPVAGIVMAVNPAMETAPEIINQDPYGEGWLAVMEPLGGVIDVKQLLEPKAYFARIKLEAEQESDQHDKQ